MNRPLMLVGGMLLLVGALWPWLKRVPLFHLPGDIVIERPGLRFFFPITTMLILSVVITLLLRIFRR